MNSGKTNVQKLTINALWKHPNLLLLAQKCRYILMRGPLQGRIVRYYQNRAEGDVRNSYALSKETLFPEMDVKKVVGELNEKGYSVAFQVPEMLVVKMMDYRNLLRKDNIHHPHKTCETFNEIVCDPNVIAVARDYLGIEPILYGSRIYAARGYNPETEKQRNRRNVHFDVADYKDLNLFIYLTDVDDEASPHIVVEGTHKHKTFRDLVAQRYTQAEARKKFGEDKFKTITGRKGVAFFEDSSAFHIQTRGKIGRVMATANYTLQRRPELARY